MTSEEKGIVLSIAALLANALHKEIERDISNKLVEGCIGVLIDLSQME